MLNITVVNIATFKAGGRETVVYIGRPNTKYELSRKGSPLANPFNITATCSRVQAVEQYRQWLWAEIKRAEAENTVNKAYDELCRLWELAEEAPERGTGLVLVCWCAPQACHGDVLVKAITWLHEGCPKA